MKKSIILRVFALIIAVVMLVIFCGGVVYSVRKSIIMHAAGETSASAMCTMDVATGRVLFAVNSDTKRGMASTTKIITALTVLENIDNATFLRSSSGDNASVSALDIKITVDDRAIGIEGSSIYLQKGEQLTIRELLYGLMLRSGNDAAIALALAVAPSVEEFAFLMNQTAKKYGANNSNFMNPHGLDDKNHYTTAKDLAILSAVALKNPTFAEIVATQTKQIDGIDAPRVLINKNKLLKTLDGCIGVKTGFTKKCGRCFVGAREINGQKIVSVVLNCGPMFQDTAELLEEAYATYPNRQVLTAEQIFVDSDGRKAVATENFAYPLSEIELKNIDIRIAENEVTVYFGGDIIHRSECVEIDMALFG
jgi:D-alanyl-D-alanine carboxypeptidase